MSHGFFRRADLPIWATITCLSWARNVVARGGAALLSRRSRPEVQLIAAEGIMIRERALKVVLVLVGLLFSAGIYPVAGSLWHAHQSDYGDDMMLSLYVALGVFLLIAVRNPRAHRSLIAFAAWSSFAHASVMTILGLHDAGYRGGFLAGSAVLVVIGITLIALAPAKQAATRESAAAV